MPGGALEDGTSPLQAGLLRLVCLEHGSSCRVASGTPWWGWCHPQGHSLQEAQARRPRTSARSRIRMSYRLQGWGSLCVFVCMSKTLYFFLGNFFFLLDLMGSPSSTSKKLGLNSPQPRF